MSVTIERTDDLRFRLGMSGSHGHIVHELQRLGDDLVDAWMESVVRESDDPDDDTVSGMVPVDSMDRLSKLLAIAGYGASLYGETEDRQVRIYWSGKQCKAQTVRYPVEESREMADTLLSIRDQAERAL